MITDADYAECLNAQEMVLLAQAEERKVLDGIRVRLERGALDAGKKHYFDARLGIVRRREKKAAR